MNVGPYRRQNRQQFPQQRVIRVRDTRVLASVGEREAACLGPKSSTINRLVGEECRTHNYSTGAICLNNEPEINSLSGLESNATLANIQYKIHHAEILSSGCCSATVSSCIIMKSLYFFFFGAAVWRQPGDTVVESGHCVLSLSNDRNNNTPDVNGAAGGRMKSVLMQFESNLLAASELHKYIINIPISILLLHYLFEASIRR